jgi:hypothetical protein
MKNIYSNTSDSNRNKIIQDNNYLDLIYNYFDNSLFIQSDSLNPNKSFLFIPIPIYRETEKYSILFANKQLSTFINTYMAENNLSEVHDNDDWSRVFFKSINGNINEYQGERYNEFKNILNGKSEKDLIIVIRNPIYKFISGVIEDVFDQIRKSSTLQSYIIEKSNNISLKDLFNKNNIDDNIFKELIINHLNFVVDSELTISNGHSRFFNNTFFNFLSVNNRINTSKIKIIDMDNPNINITNFITSYYPDTNKNHDFWTNRAFYKIVFDVLGDVKNNNKKIFDVIIKDIDNDYYYYSIIKKLYKNNLVK